MDIRLSFTFLPIQCCFTRNLILMLAFAALSSPAIHAEEEVQTGTLRFRIVNQNSQLTPARIHLYNKEGEPHLASDSPSWHDHFISSGETTLKLPPDIYRWEMERGPEHDRLAGEVLIQKNASVHVNAQINRLPSLTDNGLIDEHWYSGDLHVHRSVSDIKTLMDAEDLNFATVIEWWNAPAKNSHRTTTTTYEFSDHRLYSTMAGEDEREGGALLYFNLEQPLDLSVKNREYPSPMVFLEQARTENPNVWIDVEKTFWWDVPLWAALADPDSIGIAHNHMHRSGVLDNEAWGKTRDRDRYPGPRGNGQWTQEIYYHLLNCGFRIPPSAGSASGVLPNPVGHNRVYVQLDGQRFAKEAWFNALRQGKCFVTNGPLLRVKANGEWPGADLENAERVTFDIALTSRTPVSCIEIVQNGKIVESIPCDHSISQTFKRTISLDNQGWFLVRAIGTAAHTYQFASTAPWFLGSPEQGPYLDPESAKFFVDWVNERIERVKLHLPDREQESSVLEYHLRAKNFWEQRLQLAQEEPRQRTRTLRAIGYPDSISLLLELKRLSESQSRGSLPNQTTGSPIAANHSSNGETDEVINFTDEQVINRAIRRAYLAHSKQEIEEALAPLVWLEFSINPESRVKIQSTKDRMRFHQGIPLYRLAKIENTAGITAQLNLSAIDLSTDPPCKVSGFDVAFVERANQPNRLTGGLNEYKIVKATTHQSGLREVRIQGDAGQGTQDLGFRATADVLLETLE